MKNGKKELWDSCEDQAGCSKEAMFQGSHRKD